MYLESRRWMDIDVHDGGGLLCRRIKDSGVYSGISVAQRGVGVSISSKGRALVGRAAKRRELLAESCGRRIYNSRVFGRGGVLSDECLVWAEAASLLGRGGFSSSCGRSVKWVKN